MRPEDKPTKVQLILKTEGPHPFDWKWCRNGQRRHFFVFFWAGHSGYWSELHFFSLRLQPHRRTTVVRKFFLKFLRREEYCGTLSMRSGSDPLKVGILGGLSWKDKTPQKHLRCFFGCKIQCRSWFCHQTWSSLMTLTSYGRLKLRGRNGQKGSIIP